MNIEKLLKDGSREMGVILDNNQTNKFNIYLNELKFWSKKINLTSFKDDENIVINHFVDSLSIVKFIKPGSNILDIGTGAGFPGVPISIVINSSKVAVIDSVEKKILFVKNLLRIIGINNVKAIKASAQDELNNISRSNFDYVVTRAVSNIKNVISFSLPYVNDSGCIVMMRGKEGADEWCVVKDNYSVILKLKYIEEFILPYVSEKRVNIILQKIN